MMQYLKGSDTLREMYPKVNENFENIDDQLKTHEQNFGNIEENIQQIETNLQDISDSFNAHKDEYAAYKNSNNLEIAKIKKEIADYKAAMALLNPNHEAKQAVEGYGIVNLPPNCANGQVSVTVKGLTATNLIKNGDFSNGTTGWMAVNGNITASNNIATHTINNTFRGDIKESGKHKAVIGNKLFVRAKMRVTNSQCQAIYLIIEYLKNDVWVGQDKAELSNPVENQWYNLFAVLELRDRFDYEDYKLTIRHQYEDENTALGKQMEVKEVIMIDLTAHGLDHLTAEEVNTMLPNWFDGTKSTISAFRIRSVSEDESQESVVYVLAKDEDGNIIKLHSLPNGVRDRIYQAEDGQWYVEKNTKEYILQESDILYFNTNRNNFDAVNIPKFDDMAEFTINSSGQAILEGYNAGIGANQSNFDSPDYVNSIIASKSITSNYLIVTLEKGKYSSLGEVRAGLAGTQLIYQLATPLEIPIQVSGTLVSYPSGTVYVEPFVADAGLYNNGITVLHQDLPIKSIEKIGKIDYETGIEYELDKSKVVINTDKLSLTHPDLQNGDIVFFIYEYDKESTIPEIEVEFYDSRYVVKDSATGKFYKWSITVTNGTPSIQLTEV